MSKPLGVGIIGAGTIFEQHARALERLTDRARLLAVSDVDEVSLRGATTRHFIPFAYRDYRALLRRPDVELVTVCTPPSTHEELVVAGLEAGKFVVCEKPLAPTLEAADRILETARRHPGKLSTVYQFRYLPEVRRAVWLRDHGRLGPLLFGQFSRYARFQEPNKRPKPGKAPKPAKRRSGWWGHWDVAGGGATMTQLIHELDLMLYLFGPATEVSAVLDTLKEPIESEDTCAATVRFKSGAMACCYGTVSAQRSSHSFDVIGATGSVHFPWSFQCTDSEQRKQAIRDVLAMYPAEASAASRPGLLRRALRSGMRAIAKQGPPETEPSEHTPYFDAVLGAIEMGKPLPVGPEEARASVELCVAIYSSALLSRPVPVPLDSTARFYRGITARDYEGRKDERTQTASMLKVSR